MAAGIAPPPPHPWFGLLEPVRQGDLHQGRAIKTRIGPGDLTESGRSYGLIVHDPSRVIEDVHRFHAELDCVALLDPRLFVDCGVHIEVPRSREVIALQTAERPGCRLEERLARKWIGAIRSNCSPV